MATRVFKAILSEESTKSVQRAIDDANELDGQIVKLEIVSKQSGGFAIYELVIKVEI